MNAKSYRVAIKECPREIQEIDDLIQVAEKAIEKVCKIENLIGAKMNLFYYKTGGYHTRIPDNFKKISDVKEPIMAVYRKLSQISFPCVSVDPETSALLEKYLFKESKLDRHEKQFDRFLARVEKLSQEPCRLDDYELFLPYEKEAKSLENKWESIVMFFCGIRRIFRCAIFVEDMIRKGDKNVDKFVKYYHELRVKIPFIDAQYGSKGKIPKYLVDLSIGTNVNCDAALVGLSLFGSMFDLVCMVMLCRDISK